MRIVDEQGNLITTDTPDESIAKTTTVGDKHASRRACALSKPMIEILVRQLGVELSNHNLYTTVASYFRFQGLHRLENYYNKRAAEESNHMNWIIGYLIYNDATFVVPAIEQVDVKIPDRVFPFQITVDREIQTTVEINKIMDLAMSEHDYATVGWLLGNSPVDGKLVPEQVEEESISRHILRIAKEDCDWLTKADNIADFYESGR